MKYLTIRLEVPDEAVADGVRKFLETTFEPYIRDIQVRDQAPADEDEVIAEAVLGVYTKARQLVLDTMAHKEPRYLNHPEPFYLLHMHCGKRHPYQDCPLDNIDWTLQNQPGWDRCEQHVGWPHDLLATHHFNSCKICQCSARIKPCEYHRATTEGAR